MIAQQQRRDAFDAMDQLEQLHGQELRRMATPEAADRDRMKLVASLVQDPLIIQYLRASGNGRRGASITEPWMAIAEQRMMSLVLASNAALRVIGNGEEPQTVSRVRLAFQYLVAQTFMWSRAVFNTVRACPMPSHVIAREILPFPFTYHSFEGAYEVICTDQSQSLDIPIGHETDGILMADVPGDNGFSLTENLSSPEIETRDQRFISAGVRYGTRFPDDLKEDSRVATGVVLSMLAFLRSPYTEIEERKLPRAWRRHGGVAKSDEEKTIHVVQLRRAAREAVESYESESKSWKHRWWVAGHFRSQWYPSRREHEVIWIAPHLKGPDDAPMLNKVYAVTR